MQEQLLPDCSPNRGLPGLGKRLRALQVRITLGDSLLGHNFKDLRLGTGPGAL